MSKLINQGGRVRSRGLGDDEEDKRHCFFGIAPLGLSQSCGLLGAEEQTPLEPSRV